MSCWTNFCGKCALSPAFSIMRSAPAPHHKPHSSAGISIDVDKEYQRLQRSIAKKEAYEEELNNIVSKREVSLPAHACTSFCPQLRYPFDLSSSSRSSLRTNFSSTETT